jgi:hypothetical protein
MIINKIQIKLLIFLILNISLSFAIFSQNNIDWKKMGNAPQSYNIGVCFDTLKNHNVNYIKSIDEKIKGFGTLLQFMEAEKYYNKRIKLSANIRTNDVKGKCMMWLRVDSKFSRNYLAFDNMNDRPIQGTTEWHKYEIVLDVSPDASNLFYGVLIIGEGEAFVDNLVFELVDEQTVVTGWVRTNKPLNLNFED